MNENNVPLVKDKADFLANAELMVRESMEQYGQLADSMEIHNNPEVAVHFRELETMEKHQLRWIQDQARGLELPEIAPWDFSWHCPHNVRQNCLTDIDYLTNPARALYVALHNENLTETLYRKIAATAADESVQRAANDLADQQLEQIDLIKQRMEGLPREAYESLEDMDPPNIPE